MSAAGGRSSAANKRAAALIWRHWAWCSAISAPARSTPSRECFSDFTGLKPTSENVLGILSLITWALIVIVTLKYVVVVMRADNRGRRRARPDGPGVASGGNPRAQTQRIYVMLGMAGAALFYGDCLLTPAVSVLSAVEGLQVAAPPSFGRCCRSRSA